MGNSNLLFESIFKRSLSAAGTREFLTEITNEYPYFSPAQFFLLLLMEDGEIAFEQQVAKTSVLFNNAYWLQFQLLENQLNPQEISETPVSDDYQFVQRESRETIVRETIETDETRYSGITTHTNDPGKEEPFKETDWNPTTEEILHSSPLETPDDVIAEMELPQVVPEIILSYPAETTKETTTIDITQPVYDINIYSDQENNIDGIITEKETLPVFKESPVFAETETENYSTGKESLVASAPETEVEMIDTNRSGHFINEGTPLVNEIETEDELIIEKEIVPLNFKLNIDTENITEDKITFEPLHTSDYFASLGIRLSRDIPPSDTLGKQLKSFTEWLKTMKRIHSDHLPPSSGQADVIIQKLAEESNKEDAVLTEAMAEVLLQQGKADKAIEVYKKLSLLIPSKSAYFAAKIDHLKEH